MKLYMITFCCISILLFSFVPKGDKLSVTSDSFKHNEMIPLKFSCEGVNINPALKVSGIPAKAVTLAVIMHDPDAPIEGGFTHWVVWNIDANGNIPENYTGSNVGMNGAKKKGYMGMCPRSGIHHYHFMVYALDAKLNIDGYVDKTTMEEAMKGHILARGRLTGLYQKQEE